MAATTTPASAMSWPCWRRHRQRLELLGHEAAPGGPAPSTSDPRTSCGRVPSESGRLGEVDGGLRPVAAAQLGQVRLGRLRPGRQVACDDPHGEGEDDRCRSSRPARARSPPVHALARAPRRHPVAGHQHRQHRRPDADRRRAGEAERLAPQQRRHGERGDDRADDRRRGRKAAAIDSASAASAVTNHRPARAATAAGGQDDPGRPTSPGRGQGDDEGEGEPEPARPSTPPRWAASARGRRSPVRRAPPRARAGARVWWCGAGRRGRTGASGGSPASGTVRRRRRRDPPRIGLERVRSTGSGPSPSCRASSDGSSRSPAGRACPGMAADCPRRRACGQAGRGPSRPIERSAAHGDGPWYPGTLARHPGGRRPWPRGR